MRECLFHGVEAIRACGLGQDVRSKRHPDVSCLRRVPATPRIAFANYPQFLKAFKRGEVTKMIVVPPVGELPTYLAMP